MQAIPSPEPQPSPYRPIFAAVMSTSCASDTNAAIEGYFGSGQKSAVDGRSPKQRGRPAIPRWPPCTGPPALRKYTCQHAHRPAPAPSYMQPVSCKNAGIEVPTNPVDCTVAWPRAAACRGTRRNRSSTNSYKIVSNLHSALDFCCKAATNAQHGFASALSRSQ